MIRKRYREFTGHTEQMAYVRRAVLTEGKADGMKIVEAANAAGLSLTLFESRCLDIARLSYKGMNMGFVCKAGWVSPANYSSVDGSFSRHFPGGMLYTCGHENIGRPSEKNGNELKIHGSLGMTPAENVSAEVDWEKGVISVKGTMRSAELFGGSFDLKRKVLIHIFDNKIEINDTAQNTGFADEDMELLYHFNFGYPMLSEELKLHINDESMEPRDENAESGRDRWDVFEAPTAGRPEEVYYHSPKAAHDGTVHVKLENAKIKTGAKLVFDKTQLPQLAEWKSMASGDYALGIEPATARVEGYAKEKEAGRVITLAPGEKKEFNLVLSFYDI